MNSSEILSIALGLQSPWYVERVEFADSAVSISKESRLHLNFGRGYKFEDGQGNKSSAYDTVERVWQHLSFFRHSCYLYARVPRINTPDGEIHQANVPWARLGSGFTYLFEAYTMLLIESDMLVSRVSSCVKGGYICCDNPINITILL